MKISFDFDSTLAEDRTQKLCRRLIEDGHDIYITTTRPHKFPNGVILENRDLFFVADQLGIDKDKIRFTGGTDKYHFLEGFDIHFDDDQVEIELIEEHLENCIGVLILDPEF